MKKKLLIMALAIFSVQSIQAQLNPLKKKNKEEKQAADSLATNKDGEEKEKKKSGGFFQKMVGKISKGAGNMVGSASGMVATLDNLEEADVIASMGTNIYSKDLGLIVTDFLGKDWVNNGDFTMLQLSSKDAYKTYKYGGSIKVNGTELRHVSMGIYTATENPGTTSKKISFERNGVVEGSFEIPMPARKIKLVSVNGQSSNAKVDLTKEVTLELSNYSTGPDALVRIDVVGTILGIRSLYMVAYVKPADKLVLPAAAFRNIETTNNGVKFKDCYLAVSDQQLVKALNPSGKIPASQQVVTGSNDGMWIDVGSSSGNSDGFTINSGKAVVTKKNAAYAKPLSFARNVAVSSFYTYGTTYLYDVKNNNWTQSTTTKTIDFPDIPDAYLKNMLDDLYAKMTLAYAEVMGSNVMPVTTIPALPAYANTKKFFPEEVNNDGEFLVVHKELAPLRTLSSVNNSYYGENTLLNEAKADALLKVSLICQLSWDNKPKMTPYLSVELVGASNGGFRSYAGSTKYFSMNITGNPYELKKGKEVQFDNVFQVDEFVSEFRKALAALKAKEQTLPEYEQIWNLQR